MANLNTLTFASSNTYKSILRKFGYVKPNESTKLLLLDFLFDISTDSDYIYIYNLESNSFQIDTTIANNLNNLVQNVSFCLMNHSCLINDSVTETTVPDPPDGGGVVPPISNLYVEFTFDGGVSWYPATKLGIRSYEVVFEGIPTIDTCGWRFHSDYHVTDFKIYSNGTWAPEVYYGEDDTHDRWNVYIGNDDIRYFYWHEVNSQGRPGVIYKQVKYRFNLTT